jgi:hypothetical protein
VRLLHFHGFLPSLLRHLSGLPPLLLYSPSRAAAAPHPSRQRQPVPRRRLHLPSVPVASASVPRASSPSHARLLVAPACCRPSPARRHHRPPGPPSALSSRASNRSPLARLDLDSTALDSGREESSCLLFCEHLVGLGPCRRCSRTV